MEDVTFSGLALLSAPGRVMIPPPASEQLVAAAVARVGGLRARVADVGTGSGAIAVAIASACPRAEVWATDTSVPALAVARANVRRHGLDERVFVRQGDLLDPAPRLLDVVVANLPYIPASTAAQHPDLRAEPFAAVFAPGDGLDPYRRLIEAAVRRLRANGVVLLQLYGRVVAATRAELPALRASLGDWPTAWATSGTRVRGDVRAAADGSARDDESRPIRGAMYRPVRIEMGPSPDVRSPCARRALVVTERRRKVTGPIISGVDGSPDAQAALKVAEQLADRLGSTLILAHVAEPAYVPYAAAYPFGGAAGAIAVAEEAESEEEDSERLLERVAVAAGLEDAERRVAIGHPAERLAELADDENAELVVVGSRGRGALKSAILGSVSYSLVGIAGCPVLIVPPGASEEP